MAEELRFAMRCHGSRQKPALRRSCSRCSPEGTYVPAAVDSFPPVVSSVSGGHVHHNNGDSVNGGQKSLGFGFSNPYDHNHDNHHNGHHDHLIHRSGYSTNILGAGQVDRN